MGKYTREKLQELSQDALVVLYAFHLAAPKPKSDDELVKIIDDCKLMDKTKDDIIGYLVGN